MDRIGTPEQIKVGIKRFKDLITTPNDLILPLPNKTFVFSTIAVNCLMHLYKNYVFVEPIEFSASEINIGPDLGHIYWLRHPSRANRNEHEGMRHAVRKALGLATEGSAQMPTRRWSDTAEKATREAIEAGGVLSPDGVLHLKHIPSGFGYIGLTDLIRGELRVVDKETKAETTFASVDDLIAAGWAVD